MELAKKEDARNPTATPSDPRKLIVPVVVLGILAVLMGLGWMAIKAKLARQTVIDAPIKGIIVTNRHGDVVEHDSRAKVSFGQNLLLLLPYSETAEARQRMEMEKEITLNLPMGRVEMCRTTDDRWVGVVK